MIEETSQAACADKDTTESDSENDQTRDRDMLTNPFINWRKRGHIRAEPDTLRTGKARKGSGESTENN
jgi:hypothetical protein